MPLSGSLNPFFATPRHILSFTHWLESFSENSFSQEPQIDGKFRGANFTFSWWCVIGKQRKFAVTEITRFQMVPN